MKPASQTSVAILLVSEFSQLVLTLLMELLRISQLTGDHRFNVTLCSVSGQPVRASNGREQPVDAALHDVGKVDVAIASASYNPLSYLGSAVANWLRRQYRHGAIVCGVDTGTFMLADAGLLTGRCATLHWDDLQLARSQYPDTEFTSALFERDGRLLTSCGSLGTTDFTVELIALIAGRDVAERVLDLAVHDRNQGYSTTANPVVGKAIKMMSKNIETPLSIARIAKATGVSPRHLSRMFNEEFGVSPVGHYLEMRLNFADELVRKTRFPLSEVALASGFGSLSWFSRSYKDRFGVSPNSARQQKSAGLLV